MKMAIKLDLKDVCKCRVQFCMSPRHFPWNLHSLDNFSWVVIFICKDFDTTSESDSDRKVCVTQVGFFPPSFYFDD